jgi:hypothetical protein
MSAAASSRPRPRRRWIWVIVALLTAAACVLPAALRIWLKEDMQQEADRIVKSRRGITALQVTAPGDAVSISPGRPGETTLASSLSWVFSKPVVRRSWRGSTLEISVTCPRPDLFEDCGASLTVHVPAGTEVRADVGSGSVEAVGMTGPLHLAATSGMVTMTHVSGPLWARATSGAISARAGVNSRLVTVAVTSGWLDLGFDSAPERLTVDVGSGGGQVTVPAGTQYRLTSSTGPGLLRTASGLADARSGRFISASVGAGQLRIS